MTKTLLSITNKNGIFSFILFGIPIIKKTKTFNKKELKLFFIPIYLKILSPEYKKKYILGIKIKDQKKTNYFTQSNVVNIEQDIIRLEGIKLLNKHEKL